MHLLCVLLLGLPVAPYVRWIDEKGDIHVDELREVIEESPAEARVKLADGSLSTVRMARVLDFFREREDQPEERALLDARRDVEAGIRFDAARPTLDRLAGDGSQPWIREYAAATRALLAERARETDALARLQRFLDDYPRSRFQCECILAAARARGLAHGKELGKAVAELRPAHDRIIELDGPLELRFRTLRDGVELLLPYQSINFKPYFFDQAYEGLMKETGDGKDYGAFLLVEAEAKRGMLLAQQHYAAGEEAAGRKPKNPLYEVKKMRDAADLDLPEVRSDLERELGRLMLSCGDKEGARGAWERARDLAPDPRRREAAEEALRKLAGG